MIPLSPSTEARLELLFAGIEFGEARRLLVEDCAEPVSWPSPTPEGLERIRFAVLRLSRGSLPQLVDAIVLAQTDWRDALVAAKFGDDPQAHASWWPESPTTE